MSQLRNHKPLFCDSTLQPSGVARTLLDGPLSLQTSAGLHDPVAEGPPKEEEKEKMCLREGSDEPGLPASKVEKEWESDSDDILMEDDQMDDFASSMLAAISSWHYRVRALLSNQTTMVRLSANMVLFNVHILHFYTYHINMHYASHFVCVTHQLNFCKFHVYLTLFI